MTIFNWFIALLYPFWNVIKIIHRVSAVFQWHRNCNRRPIPACARLNSKSDLSLHLSRILAFTRTNVHIYQHIHAGTYAINQSQSITVSLFFLCDMLTFTTADLLLFRQCVHHFLVKSMNSFCRDAFFVNMGPNIFYKNISYTFFTKSIFFVLSVYFLMEVINDLLFKVFISLPGTLSYCRSNTLFNCCPANKIIKTLA